jgi:hypothetical protein
VYQSLFVTSMMLLGARVTTSWGSLNFGCARLASPSPTRSLKVVFVGWQPKNLILLEVDAEVPNLHGLSLPNLVVFRMSLTQLQPPNPGEPPRGMNIPIVAVFSGLSACLSDQSLSQANPRVALLVLDFFSPYFGEYSPSGMNQSRCFYESCRWFPEFRPFLLGWLSHRMLSVVPEACRFFESGLFPNSRMFLNPGVVGLKLKILVLSKADKCRVNSSLSRPTLAKIEPLSSRRIYRVPRILIWLLVPKF